MFQIIGVPISVSMKFQINVILPKVEGIGIFENITEENLIFPVLWIDQKFQLNEEIRQQISIAHLMFMAIKNIFGPILIVLGTLILVSLIFCLGCENFASGPQGLNNIELSETVTVGYI